MSKRTEDLKTETFWEVGGTWINVESLPPLRNARTDPPPDSMTVIAYTVRDGKITCHWIAEYFESDKSWRHHCCSEEVCTTPDLWSEILYWGKLP